MKSAPQLLASGVALAFGALGLFVGCSPPPSTQAPAPSSSTAPAAGRPESVPQSTPAAPTRPAKVEEEEETRPHTTRPVPKVDGDEGTRPKPPRKEEEEEPRPVRKPPGEQK